MKLKLRKAIKCLFIVMFLTTANLYSQIDNGLKLDIGLSQVNQVAYNNDDDKVRPGFSSQFGYYANVPLSERFYLGTELTVGFIQSRIISESFSIRVSDMQRFDHTTKHIRNLYYLNVPLMIGFKLNKIQLNGGIQGGIKIHNTYKSKRYTEGRLDKTKKLSEKYDINKYDYGARIRIGFLVSKRLLFSINYYHSLTDTLEKERLYDWQSRQLTIGALYKFSTTRKR